MTDPLAVRIDDGITDRYVKCTGLRFRKSATGGWTSAQATVVTGNDTFSDLGPDDRIYVYDNTGTVVWEGYLDNPGLTRGPLGQSFDVSALGPSKWALAAAYPRLWVDQRLTAFQQSGRSTKNADLAVNDLNSDEDFQALQVAANDGASVSTAWTGEWKHNGVRAAGQVLGRFRFDWEAGITDANYTVRLVTSNANGAGSTVDSHTSSTAGGSLSGSAGGGTPIPSGHDVARFKVTRETSTTPGSNTMWWQAVNVVVRSMLVDVNGANITSGYAANYVLSSEVIADCIGGGLLQLIDPARVTIDTTTTQIDQLAADEAVTGGGVIDMLSIYDDLTWGYYESSAAGLHRARFQLYDTEPRYVISTRDGFAQPGSEADVCNRVAVSYMKPNGKQVTKIVKLAGATAPWKDFDAITLPDGFGSSNNAASIGQRVLAQSQFPPKSATAVVRRKILDLQTGRLVFPWEIEPGYPVLVQETGDVLRLSETEYDHDSRAVTLMLGTPRRTTEQWVAMLTKKSAFLGPATYALPALTATVHKKKGK